MYPRKALGEIYVSWMEADEICKEWGGYLPIFLDKYDMQEFVYIYKQMQCFADEEAEDK